MAFAASADGLEMVWPRIEDAGWHTALLEVTVTPGGADDCPFISVESAARMERQHFAPDDSGVRWLNLSFLRGSIAAGAFVRLHGHGIFPDSGGARLRLFADCPDLSKRILVLSPHPDDAEIAAFGLYTGRDATIVTITAGNAGPGIGGANFHDIADMYACKGRRRVIESVTVPWHGGIPPERCFNLGYFDGCLDRMYATPDVAIPEMYAPNFDTAVFRRYNIGSLLPRGPRLCNWHNLVDDLFDILAKVQPGLLVTPHPQLDGHADHQFTAVALSEALVRWQRPVSVLLYTNHSSDDTYPLGPAGTLVSLPVPSRLMKLDAIYSHEVAPDIQRMKSFALESHHEVRTFDATYLTRAVRANELFYLCDERSFKSVTDGFLASKTGQHYSQQAVPANGSGGAHRVPRGIDPEKAASMNATACSLEMREFTYPLEPSDAEKLSGFIKDIERQYRVNLGFKYPEYWNWLYRDARSLVLEEEGRIVGHVGRVPFLARQDGQPKQGNWSVDTFVLSRYRGNGHGRQLQAAAQERSPIFASVWMSPANSHIKRSIGQEVAATLEVLCRPRGEQRPVPAYQVGSPVPVEIAEAAARRLPDWNFYIERSPEYCAWRFLDQPRAGYRQINCGRGVALARRCGPQRGRAGMIGDAFPADASHEAMEELLESACDHLFSEGCESVRFGSTDPATVEFLLKRGWSHVESMPLHVSKGSVSGSVFLSLSDHDIDQYPW